MDSSETSAAPTDKRQRRHPTISLAEFSAIHDVDVSELDRPVSLKQACEQIFANEISVATLKAEHRRGNLDLFKIGRQYFTTRRDIAAMKEKCRLPSKAGSHANPTDSRIEAARLHAAQVALRLSLARRKIRADKT
ncbi:hypothetical protein ACVIGB_002022 [Bradyrhizobium sp. USDA 4341]